jgi:hypothetical protein
MNQIKKFEFRKSRGFSDCISTTFDFVRMNYKTLLKIFIRIPGPLILIASVIIAYSFTDLLKLQEMSLSNQSGDIPTDYFSGSALIFLGFILFGAASLLYTASINEYVVMYEKSDDPTVIPVKDIFRKAKSRFWTYVGAAILAGIIVMAGMLILFLPGIYFAVSLIFIFIIISVENLSVGNAISRSFVIIRGNWWSVFGFIIVMGIIVMALSYLIQIPILILNTFLILKQTHGYLYSGLYILSTSISYIIYTAISALTAISLAIYYFSIVEKKEQVGLQQEISKMDEITEEKIDG